MLLFYDTYICDLGRGDVHYPTRLEAFNKCYTKSKGNPYSEGLLMQWLVGIKL